MLVTHGIGQLIYLKLKDKEDLPELKKNKNHIAKEKKGKTQYGEGKGKKSLLVGQKNYQKDKIEEMLDIHNGQHTEVDNDKYMDPSIHDMDLSDDESNDDANFFNNLSVSNDEDEKSENGDNINSDGGYSDEHIENSHKYHKFVKKMNRIDIEPWIRSCSSLKKILDGLDEFEFFDKVLTCLNQSNKRLYEQIWQNMPKFKLDIYNKLKGSRKVVIEGEAKIRKIRKIKV